MAFDSLVTMDHINSFFSLDRTIEPIEVEPTLTGGLGIDNLAQFPPPDIDGPKQRKGIGYARKYIQRENEEMEKEALRMKLSSNQATGLNALEDLSTTIGDVANESDLYSESAQQLYATYHKKGRQFDQNLAITKYQDQIVQLVNINQVVILQGSTGCGKTTQVPQYIFDYYGHLGRHCNIVITQPRKIAAISIARRVADEMRCSVGTLVGYQVAMDNKTSEDTRISYVTTGVLLQKLVNSRRMDMYTHVIIDEVHERDQDTDFALLVVKKLLRTNSKHVKVILMSATIDTSLFAEYFSLPGRGDPAPVIEIQGKSKEVTEHYIHELSALGVKIPPFDACVPNIPDESYDLVLKLMYVFDKIEKAEQNIPADKEYAPLRGTVLIFLPGYEEISRMSSRLRPAMVSRKYSLLPLHSSITVEEQKKAFMQANPGFRKVILSTNIAESSITVPDIKYVIDFCLTKCLVCDPDTSYTSLQLEWASKANCTQRKGRAGRVDIGRVYRMVPRDFYEQLPDYGVPEMRRCPLTQTILQVKKLDFGEPQALLALAIEPPGLSDIENSILLLKEVGALAIEADGVLTPYDGDLTFVGRIMAALPLDVRISKLIIFGYVFNCLEDCIIIAASLSLKTFLSKPFQRLLDSYKAALSWADGTFSDCLTLLNAYKMWKGFLSQGQFNRPGGYREESWAQQNFIQLKTIKEVDQLVKEITKRLDNLNIRHIRSHRADDPATEVLVLKVITAGAFYPNYFLQEELDEQQILREVSNLDPYSTVVVTGLPPNQGLLYFSALQEIMSICSPRMAIEFEERKAYIQFDRKFALENTKSEDKILQPVYFAVKMRQMGLPLELQVFSSEDAEKKMKEFRAVQQRSLENQNRLSSKRMAVRPPFKIKRVDLPQINRLTINITISHIINCGHFWARYNDQETNSLINFIGVTVNMNKGAQLTPVKRPLNEQLIGVLILAPYVEGTGPSDYYRATVEAIIDSKTVLVFYVDYGNTKCVPVRDLREIDVEYVRDAPALAFECQLAEVRPSVLKSPSYKWSPEACKWFTSVVASHASVMTAKVYSVIQNVVRLELYYPKAPGYQSINHELIRRGFAEAAEESYLSKQNYDLRLRVEEGTLAIPFQPDESSVPFTPSDMNKSSLDLRKTLHKVRLRGPFSPLEVSYKGMTYLDYSRAIKIDRDSVNSVSLNHEPQDKHPQMLVAASVALTPKGDVLTTRSTTLMPKINGLPGLLCLLFAPSAELRTDPERRSYTGLVCGLGYDPETGMSLYKDHDTEVVFDTIIDNDDITEVNTIRMGINLALKSESDLVAWGESGIRKMQNKLRTGLLRLVRRMREPKDKEYRYPKSYAWRQVKKQYVLEPQLSEDSGDCPYVLPLHRAICLKEGTYEQDMRHHFEELCNTANRSLERKEILCKFCNITLYTPRSLMLHLDNEQHRANEERLLKS